MLFHNQTYIIQLFHTVFKLIPIEHNKATNNKTHKRGEGMIVTWLSANYGLDFPNLA